MYVCIYVCLNVYIYECIVIIGEMVGGAGCVGGHVKECVCVSVFFPFILDIKFVGRSSGGHTGGRSHRISHPPSFCCACLNFFREKDSAIPFPRQP